MLRANIVLGLVVVSLVGCGPKNRYSTLNVEKVQSISVAAVTARDGGNTFCTNGLVEMRVTVTYKNGKQVTSRVYGDRRRGHLRSSDFAWSSSLGTMEPNALLRLPKDLLSWFDQPLLLRVSVVKNPEFIGEATLHPRFDCGETADVRGAEGARGGEAEHGGPGEEGHEIRVALGYVDTKHSGRLILVRVNKSGAGPKHYIVDTRNPKAEFVVDARGGAGGQGGQGEWGIDGVPGVPGRPGLDGVGCQNGTRGEAGTAGTGGGGGGPAGNGDRGGKGGRVLVRYDARFPELTAKVRIRVEGGDAGVAGRGGQGGRGGRGGAAGKAGKAGKELAANCNGTAGSDGGAGSRGADGNTGARGTDGRPGTAGGPGSRRTSATSVAELFADEIKRGIPVATGTGGNQAHHGGQNGYR